MSCRNLRCQGKSYLIKNRCFIHSYHLQIGSNRKIKENILHDYFYELKQKAKNDNGFDNNIFDKLAMNKNDSIYN